MTPIAWVHKRDGRLVPFEADKISRALFAASDSLGRPDPFLARELTDSILHFLSAESNGSTPTTPQIADLVIKVVRELGQPELARVFADGQARKVTRGLRLEARGYSLQPREKDEGRSTKDAAAGVGPKLDEVSQWVKEEPSPHGLVWRAAGSCLRDYVLRELYTRDLAVAHADNLLTLTGLETPLELAGYVLPAQAFTGGGVVEAIEDARQISGEFLAVDSPEYLLAHGDSDEKSVAALVRELAIGLRSNHLRAVINLNCAIPPPWAEDLAAGPLFEGHRQTPESGQLAEWLDLLLENILLPGTTGSPVRIDWHLSQGDFLPVQLGRLLRLARRALEGTGIAFVFDRSRRSISLAEGLDRQHPAVLLTVGLHLPRLVQQLGGKCEPALFLQKLGSLARLALSAATQKREFLRRHSQRRPALARGFLLDRARLVVVPIGLEAATQALLGKGLCSSGAALEFARQVVQRLRSILQQDGRAYLLDTCLDSWLDTQLTSSPDVPLPTTERAAGLTPWDFQATARDQLRAASVLHATAEAGTVAVLVSENRSLTPEQGVDLLCHAWQQTDVVRIRFARCAQAQHQLTAF